MYGTRSRSQSAATACEAESAAWPSSSIPMQLGLARSSRFAPLGDMAGPECGGLGGPEGLELFSAFPERGSKPPSHLDGTSTCRSSRSWPFACRLLCPSSPSLYVGIFCWRSFELGHNKRQLKCARRRGSGSGHWGRTAWTRTAAERRVVRRKGELSLRRLP
jgi:hypothetical protein